MPKSRPDFWERKLDENVRRDEEVVSELIKLGWKVLTIWECQIAAPDGFQDRLIRFLDTE